MGLLVSTLDTFDLTSCIQAMCTLLQHSFAGPVSWFELGRHAKQLGDTGPVHEAVSAFLKELNLQVEGVFQFLPTTKRHAACVKGFQENGSHYAGK